MCEWTKGAVPHGYWKESKKRREFADWLGEKLGCKAPADWYRVRRKDIQRNFGGGLLKNYYANSVNRFVTENYPEHQWKQWLFANVPNGFWDDPANRHAFMTDLGNILGYQQPEDWYQLTCRLIHEHGGGGLLVGKFEGSPQMAVIEHIPDYPWQVEEFTAGKKTQKALFSIVQKYMWTFEKKWDHKYQAMRFFKSDYPMELDVFIPHFRIAIEYQGEQHFFPIECWGGEAALSATQARDEEKRKMCKVHHIDLIEINYTWRGDKSTIIEAIRRVIKERQENQPKYRMVGSDKYKLFLPVRNKTDERPASEAQD